MPKHKHKKIKKGKAVKVKKHNGKELHENADVPMIVYSPDADVVTETVKKPKKKKKHAKVVKKHIR